MHKFLIPVIFFIFVPTKTFAYIDPGTGSFIFQIIIGGILGGIFAIKLYFKKIKLFLSSMIKKDKKIKK